jgi:dTDP-4-amino-4,6-dideoxygalactose transaminase
MRKIPFNRPSLASYEMKYILEAVEKSHLAGGGYFTKKSEEYLRQYFNGSRVLLTHSCTAALEMAALLLDIAPGDEVIMPSFTFVSTANAFVLRGGVPVFVDIRPDTLNIDENLIRQAITPRTRAIAVVHYAGVACDMGAINAIAAEHGLAVVEDAAQAHFSTWKDRPLGGIGQLGTLSFHETKNIISGEGGALIVNDPVFVERAEVIWQKGTNRLKFERSEVDKYSWVDLGSSFLPSEMIAAFLYAQLEEASSICTRRMELWNRYHKGFEMIAQERLATRPQPPVENRHNGHIYYLLVPKASGRADVLHKLGVRGVQATSHYVPLHSSPAGQRYARSSGALPVTDDVANRLIRLPLFAAMTDSDVDYVVEAVTAVLKTAA